MNDRDLGLLRRCPLFRSTPEAQLRAQLERVPHGVSEYDADALIRSQGDRYDELLILLKGQVAGEFRTHDGRLMRVETLAAPEALASAFLFSPQARLPVDMVAVTDVRLFRIGREALLSVASACPEVLERLLRDISHRTEFLATKLRMVQFETLRERVAHYLLELMRAQSRPTVELPVAKKELADILGSARQSVFRCLGELEEQGLIAQHGRSVHILDSEGLRMLAEAAE
ncbi:MAG: helix-turn-helix domain-containing protein [Spirochaetes bacterium]|nr:helix-turn-helix domain-containing protein [Spirochaetota bacterium]